MKTKLSFLKVEWIKCINGKEFKFIFTLMLLLNVLSYIIEMVSFLYGKNVMWLPQIIESSFMVGLYATNLFQFFIFFFPLICVSIYAMSFLEEKQNGTAGNYYLRGKYSDYIWAKGIVVFFATFLTIVIPILLNLLFCSITLPAFWSTNNFAAPHYREDYYSNFFAGTLYAKHPVCYLLLIITMNGLYGGIVALLALGISMYSLLKYCNPYIFNIGFFILFESISILLQNFHLEKFDYSFYIDTSVLLNHFEIWQLVCFMGVQAIAAAGLIWRESRRKEYI